MALPAALRFTQVLEHQGGADLSCLRRRRRRRNRGSEARGAQPGSWGEMHDKRRDPSRAVCSPHASRAEKQEEGEAKAGPEGAGMPLCPFLLRTVVRVRQWPRALGLCVQTRGSMLARQLRLDPGADLF